MCIRDSPIAVEDIQHIVWKLKDKNIGILITDHNALELSLIHIWAVRPLKWHASWVQNVVRQFGRYLSCAQDI